MKPSSKLNKIPMRDRWSQVKLILEMESRFYNSSVVRQLDYVFGAPNEYKKLYKDKSVVRQVKPGAKFDIFRSRHFASADSAKKALLVPEKELAGPPHSVAKAGRMNADGISVFYGATDMKVAVAETRPPVGSYVVVARFCVAGSKKSIKLLSVEDLREAYSNHIKAGEEKEVNMRFIENFSNQVMKPIVPENASTEYIITQVISDYLSSRHDIGINGLMYKSAQTDEENHRNVVLFHRSSQVNILGKDEANSLIEDIESKCFENLKKGALVAERKSHKKHFKSNNQWEVDDPTLELDVKSISLFKVINATYDPKPVKIW